MENKYHAGNDSIKWDFFLSWILVLFGLFFYLRSYQPQWEICDRLNKTRWKTHLFHTEPKRAQPIEMKNYSHTCVLRVCVWHLTFVAFINIKLEESTHNENKNYKRHYSFAGVSVSEQTRAFHDSMILIPFRCQQIHARATRFFLCLVAKRTMYCSPRYFFLSYN